MVLLWLARLTFITLCIFSVYNYADTIDDNGAIPYVAGGIAGVLAILLVKLESMTSKDFFANLIPPAAGAILGVIFGSYNFV